MGIETAPAHHLEEVESTARRHALAVLVAGAAAASLCGSGSAAKAKSPGFAYPRLPSRANLPLLGGFGLVRRWTISYIAHNGFPRRAYVVLPRWYGPGNHPPLPLIISPHGRGIAALDNARRWGNLPALGRFALVNPEGQGRELTLYSWGDPGEIADLARMPRIVTSRLGWLRIDRGRVYAFGSSMGGQETLLLVAEHPTVLAGAAAFDSATNLAARYAAFPLLRFGLELQRLARIEVGGPPWLDPRAWAVRSPIDWARQIAFSGVPLQIWWSWKDRIVVDQARESGALYRTVKRLNPAAPVAEHVGTWAHSAEFRATRRLPYALALFGLMPPYRAHAPGLVGTGGG
jgi:poly(3-hydroxybutyrate) depolymerase